MRRNGVSALKIQRYNKTKVSYLKVLIKKTSETLVSFKIEVLVMIICYQQIFHTNLSLLERLCLAQSNWMLLAIFEEPPLEKGRI